VLARVEVVEQTLSVKSAARAGHSYQDSHGTKLGLKFKVHSLKLVTHLNGSADRADGCEAEIYFFGATNRDAARRPAGHPGSFNDVLGALDYLLSEHASYVSGTNLLVTGAWNLG